HGRKPPIDAGRGSFLESLVSGARLANVCQILPTVTIRAKVRTGRVGAGSKEIVVKRERAVTLRDVAERSGVAISTASRALSRPGRVSPATTERVRAAARELGYTPTMS